MLKRPRHVLRNSSKQIGSYSIVWKLLNTDLQLCRQAVRLVPSLLPTSPSWPSSSSAFSASNTANLQLPYAPTTCAPAGGPLQMMQTGSGAVPWPMQYIPPAWMPAPPPFQPMPQFANSASFNSGHGASLDPAQLLELFVLNGIARK